MFGIGPYEMLIILAVGLMLFSPKELPGVIKGIARFWGSVRRTADEFRDAIMQDDDLREPLDELKSAYDGAKDEMRGAELQARRELMKARMEVRRAEAKLAEAARHDGSELPERVAAGGPDALEDAHDEDEPTSEPASEVEASDQASETPPGPAPVLPPPPGGSSRDPGAGLGVA